MKTYEQLQEDIDNDKNPSIDEVWNAAIEAAAKIADDVAGLMASTAIMRLKK